MRATKPLIAVALLAIWPSVAHGESLAKTIKKAVDRATLDQPGTKPFHLKASLAPSFDRDKDSGRTGTVEIWWASPTEWKRDVRSPAFHQIEIVNGTRRWQKNEGDYFPQWLQQVAVELVKPVPPVEEVLEHAKGAQPRTIMGQMNIGWTTTTGTAEVPNISRSWLALQPSTGLLLYAGGPGWGADFNNYRNFHDRMVARVVKAGTPEVTATVTVLEDLGPTPPLFFDVSSPGGDPQPLETLVIDEPTLRKNLLPMDPIVWPPLRDGPMTGNVTTEVVIDREGRVRDMGTMVSDNPAIDDAAKKVLTSMQFRPFASTGGPTQVMAQITLPFKTSRPVGTENFETARTYFERGREISFPSAGRGKPYVLHAEFEVGKSGTVEKGIYTDTWLSDTQWRREASLGKSRYIRSRNGDKTYQVADGPDANLLRFVVRVTEPIPATDTFVESDWRIKRDTVNGARAVRVLTGYESPEGQLDPEQARGYWFDGAGVLVKTYFSGVETLRSEFADFNGVKIARQINLLKNGALGMRIRIADVSPAGQVPAKDFEVRGHEWTHAFTDQVR